MILRANRQHVLARSEPAPSDVQTLGDGKSGVAAQRLAVKIGDQLVIDR